MKERLAAIEAAAGEPPVWNGTHAAEWSRFLNTPVGKHLMLVLAYYRPAFELCGNPTKLSATTGRVAGFELALSILASLRNPDNDLKNLKEQYPGLDDDLAWAGSEPNPNQ